MTSDRDEEIEGGSVIMKRARSEQDEEVNGEIVMRKRARVRERDQEGD